MSYIITEFSKYIICGALFLYLIESIWPLFKVGGDKDRGVYLRQTIYIMLIHILSMVSLYLITDDFIYIKLYVFQLLCIFLLNRLTVIIYDKGSCMMVNHMCLLMTIGFIEVARLAPQKSSKQIIIDLISSVIFMFIPILVKKCKFLREYGVLFGTAGIVLLIMVFSLGKQTNGSLLSYNIMGISFQPSEFAKIIFVFFLAAMLYKSVNFGKVLVTSIVAAIYVGILVLSKDLGSALIFFMAYIAMVFVATGKARYSLLGLGAGSVGAVIAYKLFTHVQVRIAIWRDPWSDIDRTSYQIAQSLFGIGTGGWMGMGLGKGDPTSIPYVDEDFVFSAICEEFGVIFGIILILIYLAVFILLLKNTLRVKDNFYRLVQVGLSSVIAVQTFLTIGGGTRLIPMTGVTLPLISNGGSSAMSTIFIFGICLGISILPTKFETDNYENDDEEFDEEYEDEYDDEFDDEYEEEISKRPTVKTHEENLSSNLLAKRRINSYVITFIYMILYILMITNLIIYMKKDKDTAVSNEYNVKRQQILAAETYRGSILAADGTILAHTVVDASGNEIREYPYGDEYCHAVGYSTYGKTGIENYMNMYLINSSISFKTRTSNGINNIKNPGDQVITTLVPKLQDVARESLGMYKGAVVATKADTGEILCMVSTPGFDPNTIEENFEYLSSDKDKSVLLNRVSQGIYPPGSTFKIIDSLEYIRENSGSYDNYSFNCNGSLKAGDTTIHCFQHSVHGHLDLKSSLAHSCNSSFANIGLGLDKNKFADTLKTLMFNEKLPVDFENSPSKISITTHMTDDEMAQASIGQGSVGMTPLHLNMITQAIANDGIMMTPYLVSEVKSTEDEVIKEFKPKELKQVMSQDEASKLTELMISVVEEGTAKKLRGQEYTSAGKTGSAEFTGDNGVSHAWFTGFAPADNPQIVVTVILEGAGTGGDYSVPISRRIFDEYFSIYGLN